MVVFSLTSNTVITKNPSDFVGGALGQSEENTKRILKVSEGKVLVIDEAYGLDPGGRVGSGQPDPYKAAVIDTIVAQVQNVPGEDRCVLLLGYKDQMENMMNNCNLGLARRFRLSDAFHFEDFNDEELRKILDLKLKKQGIMATDEAKHVAIKILALERDRPNFGNAGAVENLISRAKEGEHKRRSQKGILNLDPEVVLLPQDFDENHNRGSQAETSCQELFKDIVGCDKMISQFGKYQHIARNMNARGLNPRDQIPFSFIFKGPPGNYPVERWTGIVINLLARNRQDDCRTESQRVVLPNGYPRNERLRGLFRVRSYGPIRRSDRSKDPGEANGGPWQGALCRRSIPLL